MPIHSFDAWMSCSLEYAVSILAPPKCAACDASVRCMVAFCADCARQVEPVAVRDGDTVAAFHYGGPIARSIVRFKYENRPDLARPLGDLLWRAIGVHSQSILGSTIIPVPLHPSRLIERGYNQSALLAGRVAHHAGPLGVRMSPRVLTRSRDTPRQVSFNARERASNMVGAFRVMRPEKIRGIRVLLIDDVKTTGATLSGCVDALREAGVTQIIRAVLASAP